MAADRTLKCATCGAARPLLQKPRQSIGGNALISVGQFKATAGAWEQQPSIIVHFGAYRNGGTGSDTHMCDDCVTLSLKAMRDQIDRLLGGDVPPDERVWWR